MRIEGNTSASIFLHLRTILREDIEVIESKIEHISKNKLQIDFLDSLKFAKSKILDLMSDSNIGINVSSPSTPEKNHFTGYHQTELIQVENQVEMIELLLKTEEAQNDMIQNAVKSNGIPPELNLVLENILRIYQTIVDHLRRSKSTQQLGRIVV